VAFAPLSAFKTTRRWAGLGYFTASYVFGTELFAYSCIVAFQIWGYTGLICGFVLGGVGVAPIALFASVYAAIVHRTQWGLPWELLLMAGLTFGTRFLGFYLITSDEQQSSSRVMPTLQLAASSPTPADKSLPEITDGLTGLYNTRHLDFMLDTEIYRSERYGWTFSLVALDLKGCQACAKSDSRFLRAIAEKIKAACRLIDLAFRCSDCEFMLLLPQTSKENARRVGRDLHGILTKEIGFRHSNPQHPELAVCVSVATWPSDGKTKAELLHSLDETTYDMKSKELATQEAKQLTDSPPRAAVNLPRTRILVVSTEEAFNKAYAEWLCRNGYEAVACDVIRGGKWAVQEAFADARTFQPHVALLFHNLQFTKEMTGLDLPRLLFERLPNTRFIVGRLGDSYCVSVETLKEAQSRGYEFDTFAIAPEGENLLELLEGQGRRSGRSFAKL
jgi:diguanylate cyclase (GGDEF)-like protein